MGWGSRQVSGGTSDQDTGGLSTNPEALQWARDGGESSNGYIGIRPFRDPHYAGPNGTGRLCMTEDLNKNELRSVAASEPYWQARLVDPSPAQCAEALLL